jgi:hypothetical protein
MVFLAACLMSFDDFQPDDFQPDNTMLNAHVVPHCDEIIKCHVA